VPPLTTQLPPGAGKAVIGGKQNGAASFDRRQALGGDVHDGPANAGVPNVEREEKLLHGRC
jgi:hypothetical protein